MSRSVAALATGTSATRLTIAAPISFRRRDVIRSLSRCLGRLDHQALGCLAGLGRAGGRDHRAGLETLFAPDLGAPLLRQLHLHGGRLAPLQREPLAAEAA